MESRTTLQQMCVSCLRRPLAGDLLLPGDRSAAGSAAGPEALSRGRSGGRRSTPWDVPGSCRRPSGARTVTTHQPCGLFDIKLSIRAAHSALVLHGDLSPPIYRTPTGVSRETYLQPSVSFFEVVTYPPRPQYRFRKAQIVAARCILTPYSVACLTRSPSAP